MEKLNQISNNAMDQTDENQKAIIQALADATTKATKTTARQSISETTESEQITPPDSAEIDLENEPIQKKRELQGSLVVNIGKTKSIISNWNFLYLFKKISHR